MSSSQPPPPATPAKAPPGYSAFVYEVSRALMFWWAKVWLRLRIEGRELAPAAGPLLLVGNHCSYLDPGLLGFSTRRPVRFLAQQGLARFPPLGWWLRKVGVSLIDRRAPSKDVLRRLSEALEQGHVVGLFPEGTRSRDGAVDEFRSGVEFLVRRTGTIVLPVGIDGTFRAMPRGAWWPRPRRCTVRVGAPWPPAQVLAPGGDNALRAEVARLARAPLATTSSARPRVGHGPGPVPADSSSSAGDGA